MQKIKNIPKSKISSIALGLAKLFGKARTVETIYSPLGKNKCVYWCISVFYYARRGRRASWETLYVKQSQNRFYLEDDTGKIFIDPKEATVDIPVELNLEGVINPIVLTDTKKIEKKYVDIIKNSEDEDLKNAILKYDKYLLRILQYSINENDNIYVLGNVEKENGQLILKKGRFEELLYISDKNEMEIVKQQDKRIKTGFIVGFGACIIGIFMFLTGLSMFSIGEVIILLMGGVFLSILLLLIFIREYKNIIKKLQGG